MRDEKEFTPNQADPEEEIDLLELAANLWKGRRIIFKWAGIGAIIGLIVAFSIPKEYTTTIKLASEANAGGSTGSLSAIAAMAGINTTGNKAGDAVTPELYPDVLSSIPFVVGLFDVPVTESENDSTYTVRNYIEQHTSTPWWSAIMALPGKTIGMVKSWFSPEEDTPSGGATNPFKLSKKETLVKEALSARIAGSYDDKTGINTISVTMQDPQVSAMLADTVAHHLQQFVTDYRTSKTRKDLEYAEQLNNEARESYYAAQQRLADYLDRNQGISLHSAQVTRDRLSNEAQLAFSLFNQTSQQVQLAKAKVQENTPVYAIVEPATVPLRASKPSKAMILIGFTIVAAIAASAKILLSDTFKALKTKVSA